MCKRILITGGGGFIGCNVAARFIRQGNQVTIYDNLSRRGANQNLQWLEKEFGHGAFEFRQADVRDANAMTAAIKGQEAIIHLAGQVAVTTSVSDPRRDFEDNALGTFNVLEAARLGGGQPIVLFASTNKVYGEMEDAAVVARATRYEYRDFPLGISETHPLDFHSPYGCSKGAADQYVRDYARIYGLPTVVLRQSCIYGPHQIGIEDQGWLAWFSIAVFTDRPITIYGDGRQVRDVLYVNDLVDVYEAVLAHIDRAAGHVFNIGGGNVNTISIWCELGPRLEKLAGRTIPVSYSGWRPGDQRIYVSDIRKARRELGWSPKTGLNEGIASLWKWVTENRALFG